MNEASGFFDWRVGLPSHAPGKSKRLSGRHVLIFGGGIAADRLGIGGACALAYGLAGAAVSVADRSADNAQRAARNLEALGIAAGAHTVDVQDAAAVTDVVNTIIANVGPVDILHNTVGAPDVRPFTDFTDADWQRSFDLNIFGAMRATRAVVPSMLDRRHGVVVNISSLAGARFTGFTYAPYAAAKAALNHLTTALALEYASHGLRFNAVLPGLIASPMSRTLNPEGGEATADGVAKARRDRSPTGFEGDVWDVANAAVFLASDEARYINGQLLAVDGGLGSRC